MRIEGKRDNNWFQSVFKEHYQYVRNFIYYLSGDLTITDDLAQDVFLVLWEERFNVKQETVRSYLFTIARNHYFKHHRKKKIQLNFSSSLVTKHENESPEYLMELKEFDQKLQSAMAQLPEKTRAIFLMNRIEKMTYQEIADNLQLSVKAIEKHISKALKHLRSKVDKQF
jgi:RNA polymerase sigma-70 factor (ECF subfamily)